MEAMPLIKALKKKLRVTTDGELASRLNVTTQTVRNWSESTSITPTQMARIVDSSREAARKETRASAIRPVVEFFHIHRNRASRQMNKSLFDVEDGKLTPHPYLMGLMKELKESRGIYIFFDSRGHAIYAGKARRQSLWKEMTLAYNRDRGSVQKIRRVRHPESRTVYKSSNEKSRQIVESSVFLHELAEYFSAYLVEDEMIDRLEALLVRSFANDLLNKRMERFPKRK